MTTATAPAVFLKGHGAQNDFLLLPDPHGCLHLTPEDVRRLCDRRLGIGADGLLRAVRCAAAPEAAAMAGEAGWFMDYRNPDGTDAQMCGNGIRVLARYLVDAGHQPPGDFALATRAGLRHVHVRARSLEFAGEVAVQMGHPRLPGPDGIRVSAGGRSWPALHVDMGNPHAVAFVDDLDDAGDLRTPPTVTPVSAYPAGVSVEFVVVRGPRHLAVRVHERGVGETRACGTGACAAVAAALAHTGAGAPSGAPARYAVDLPGGRLDVDVASDGTMQLTGPAAIVARGTLNPLPSIPGPRIGWSPARAR
ncbi:diaminopimelate epimerase [Streptomyces lunalinharesii]|uniref:Diaminopimelate epimerase n=1 Tax=Streptomyces lunalinharesii TaxID=333384 RepID=A0ABN3SXP3_9ACTN